MRVKHWEWLLMVNWKLILIQLRRNYKPLAKIAREIDVQPCRLQKMARYGVKTDISYTLGSKLIELHREHCND